MYTHIKTKHMTLELCSYISLCLPEKPNRNPAASFLYLKINSSDIQSYCLLSQKHVTGPEDTEQ